MSPRRTSAGISVRYVGTGPADRVPQVRGRGRATWLEIHDRTFRHAVCGAPLRSATSPCLYRIDEYDRIRVCRVTGALQNSGTQHESAPDNDDSSLMLPD